MIECTMSTTRFGQYLAEHPRTIGVLFVTSVLLLQASQVALAGCTGGCSGP